VGAGGNAYHAPLKTQTSQTLQKPQKPEKPQNSLGVHTTGGPSTAVRGERAGAGSKERKRGRGSEGIPEGEPQDCVTVQGPVSVQGTVTVQTTPLPSTGVRGLDSAAAERGRGRGGAGTWGRVCQGVIPLTLPLYRLLTCLPLVCLVCIPQLAGRGG